MVSVKEPHDLPKAVDFGRFKSKLNAPVGSHFDHPHQEAMLLHLVLKVGHQLVEVPVVIHKTVVPIRIDQGQNAGIVCRLKGPFINR